MNRIAIATLCCALAGCAATKTATPNYDLRFGSAVREARARMTLNPAAATGDAVAGMDGRAAHEAQERYQESFRAPPPVVNVINIGGAAKGGQ
ncbi:hypothetical protein [Ramlibacter sp. PS4R-6]|uniref:hypothetical protein n=1 Tax=Ramlibacter sp. PS4R-6 TaxID=3133438 RepID=UPI00309CF380